MRNTPRTTANAYEHLRMSGKHFAIIANWWRIAFVSPFAIYSPLCESSISDYGSCFQATSLNKSSCILYFVSCTLYLVYKVLSDYGSYFQATSLNKSSCILYFVSCPFQLVYKALRDYCSLLQVDAESMNYMMTFQRRISMSHITKDALVYSNNSLFATADNDRSFSRCAAIKHQNSGGWWWANSRVF